jgi:hypothetical protein
MFKKVINFIKYLIIHKYYVFHYGIIFKVPIINIILHDLSKIFSLTEYLYYIKTFYTKDKRKEESKEVDNYGWLEHQRNNKHHWQYWIMYFDNGDFFPLKIPKKYLLEMMADWCAAEKTRYGVADYDKFYEKNKNKMFINKETREEIVEIIKNIGELK